MGPFQTEGRKTVWKPTVSRSPSRVTGAPPAAGEGAGTKAVSVARERGNPPRAAPGAWRRRGDERRVFRGRAWSSSCREAAYLNLKLGLTPTARDCHDCQTPTARRPRLPARSDPDCPPIT